MLKYRKLLGHVLLCKTQHIYICYLEQSICDMCTLFCDVNLSFALQLIHNNRPLQLLNRRKIKKNSKLNSTIMQFVYHKHGMNILLLAALLRLTLRLVIKKRTINVVRCNVRYAKCCN